MNNRAGVRARTREIVLETAQAARLSRQTRPSGPAPSRSREAVAPRLRRCPPAPTPSSRCCTGKSRQQAAARPELDVHIATIEGFNPDSLARTLHELRAGRRASASSRSTIRPFARRSARWRPAASKVRDHRVRHPACAARRLYRHRQPRRGAAGRLSARPFLGRGSAGKVALFAGSLSYRGHEEREMGFRHILAEEFPRLCRSSKCARCMTTARRPTRGLRRCSTAIPTWRRSTMSARGNSGIARALKERGRAALRGLHRPRGDRGHQGAAARRNARRRDRPEPPRRGARGAQCPDHMRSEAWPTRPTRRGCR